MDFLLELGKARARAVLALSMTIVAIIVIILISTLPDRGTTRLLIDAQAPYFPWTIQNLMWVMFFLGLGELFFRWVQARHLDRQLRDDPLRQTGKEVITPEKVRELYMAFRARSRFPDDLPALLKRLLLQFQTTGSVGQTQEFFNAQIDLRYNRMESDYTMIRYIVWLIPTLGFIGTVMGIAMALSYAASHDPQAASFLAGLTDKLSVAFYTTLVGLVMSAILVFVMSLVQGYEEGRLHTMESYVLDHLINRLYKP
jgi:biopolymer transport protein ExbB/TolQ